MVIVRRHVTLGIHAFQEEVVGLAHFKAFKRDFATLGSLGLPHRLCAGQIRSRIVEYRYQGNFVRIPAHNGRSFSNRGTLNIAEQGAFGIDRERLSQALSREQELRREVNAGFGCGIFIPVIKQSHVRITATHQSTNWAPVFIGYATRIIAIGVRSSVMGVVFILVTSTHQERNIPRVRAQVIVHVIKSDFQISFFTCHFIQQEYRICRAHVITVKAPVKTRPYKIIRFCYMQLCRTFTRFSCNFGTHKRNRITTRIGLNLLTH